MYSMTKYKDNDIELRGFFYADGSAMIVKYNRTYKNRKYNHTIYRPQLMISQRADNLKFLEWIKENYGGSIYKRNKTLNHFKGTKPGFIWACTNIENCDFL